MAEVQIIVSDRPYGQVDVEAVPDVRGKDPEQMTPAEQVVVALMDLIGRVKGPS